MKVAGDFEMIRLPLTLRFFSNCLSRATTDPVEESIADANLDATDQRRVGGCVEHGLFAKNLMKPGGEGRLLALFEFDSCPDIYFNATPGVLDELVKCCVDHLEVSKSSIGVEDQKESHEQVGDSISED